MKFAIHNARLRFILFWILVLLATFLLFALFPPRTSLGPQGVEVESVPKRTLYARVASVNSEARSVELVLVVLPIETRIVFSGSLPPGMEGEIVQFNITKNEAEIAGRRLRVKTILWITEK